MTKPLLDGQSFVSECLSDISDSSDISVAEETEMFCEAALQTCHKANHLEVSSPFKIMLFVLRRAQQVISILITFLCESRVDDNGAWVLVTIV